MKTVFTAASIILFVWGTTFSQITINFLDIPADKGSEAQYWSEENTGSGIPVNVGTAGPAQTWNFTGVDSSSQFSQFITELDSTPYAEEFPNSNLVIESEELSPYGFAGAGYIFFNLIPSSLQLMGIALDINGMQFGIPFENPIDWYQLPMTYQDAWIGDFYAEVPFDSQGVEYRLDIDGLFDMSVDAWGELLLPSGNYQVLRVRNNINIDITLNIMLFGIPIPVYTQQSTYIGYAWVTENENMAAVIMSLLGETNPNFNLASSFAIIDEMLPGYFSLACEPTNPPVQISPGGGSFNFETTIVNNMPDPMTFDVWSMAYLPSGASYGPIVSRPNVILPPGGMAYRMINQVVPATAPAGEYYYVMFIGDQNENLIQAMEGYTFIKLGD